MKRTTYVISASSLAIFALCVIFHYIYKWSGYNEIIGAIAPIINESIFQHIKMTFIPIILYYLITYIIFRKKYIINQDKWV